MSAEIEIREMIDEMGVETTGSMIGGTIEIEGMTVEMIAGTIGVMIDAWTTGVMKGETGRNETDLVASGTGVMCQGMLGMEAV